MFKFATRKAKQQWDMEKPEHKLLARRVKFTIFILTKMKNLTPSGGTPETRDSSESSNTMRQQLRIPTAEAPKQKVAVPERERQMEAFESQRCFHTGRDHSHEDHVADRKDLAEHMQTQRQK